jgi:diaminopimelate decarboxylase
MLLAGNEALVLSPIRTVNINEMGHLTIGECDAVELAHTFGTPLYVFDENDIRLRCREYREGLSSNHPNTQVVYAGKAFLCLGMCRLIEQEGLGLDVASGGELYTAEMAGFPMDRILFHGNNKSHIELVQAVCAKVGRIVVDNLYELELLNSICRECNQYSDILLRITPGVNANTHSSIQTGQQDSKFGIGVHDGKAFDAVSLASKMSNVRLVGIHSHIGSQIFDLDSYQDTLDVVLDFCVEIKRKLGLEMEEIDLGGGLGIAYTEEDRPLSIREFSTYISKAFMDGCKERGLKPAKLIVEPGRSIIGAAGITLYTIGSIKDIPGVRKYVTVDGGMTDNPRVALYGAEHRAVVANKAGRDLEETVTIAGRCCESGDMLIWDVKLPAVEPGDILAVCSTGAYNYSMASNYNRLPRPAAVFAVDGKADLVIRRETYEDLIRHDVIPDRFASGRNTEVACSSCCNSRLGENRRS